MRNARLFSDNGDVPDTGCSIAKEAVEQDNCVPRMYVVHGALSMDLSNARTFNEEMMRFQEPIYLASRLH